MLCEYQKKKHFYLQKVSGFKDVLFSSCKDLKCVTQFDTLFQISRENKQN